MSRYTLHNEYGIFMSNTAETLGEAKTKCDSANYNCVVCETYMAKSPWRPWDCKLVEHAREVYRNF